MEMEKASLIIQKTRKGENIARVKMLKNNKVVTIQGFHPQDAEMDGMAVDVLREKGQPVLVKSGDKTIFDRNSLVKEAHHQNGTSVKNKKRKTMPNRYGPEKVNGPELRADAYKPGFENEQGLEKEHVEYIQYPSYAPYNFVSLNEKVIKTAVDEENHRPHGLTFDAYHDKFNTGWIDVEIETITPIYIRGEGTQIQQNKNQKEQTPNFFAPTGKPAIPGSSLRGMIRQMVEMVSYGKFGFFDKQKTLYYRGLADRSNLRKEYQDRMSSYDRDRKIATYNVSSGILFKEKVGLSYFIIPTQYDRITKGEAKQVIKKLGKKYKEFEFYDLQNADKYTEHYLVVSGDMKNKKHDWLIKKPASGTRTIEIPDAEPIRVPDIDIRNYRNDKTRKVLTDKNEDKVPSILNLVELLDKDEYSTGIPCFYVRWKDKKNKEMDRVSFGHTAMFRLAYEKSIRDHVPDELAGDEDEDDQSYDIAGALFGNEKEFAGRVFFEDALIGEEYNQEDVFLGEEEPKILSGPKPTTFQHYLVQSEDDLKNLKHYNSNSVIRGYKVYWHKNGNDWEEPDKNNIIKHPKQYTKINPVIPNVRFYGRIRFENLTNIELGALLFSLSLPEGCCHKIGMGKALGLGSIKITPKLYLSDRKKRRYKYLFAEWNNELPEAHHMEGYMASFEKYVLNEIGESKLSSLWLTDRLKELLIMLNYGIGQKLDRENKVDYMGLQSFSNRSILPKPSQVMDSRELEIFFRDMRNIQPT